MTTPAPEVAARPTGPDDDALDALLRAARAPSPAGLALSLGARLVQARLGLADPPTIDRYVVARKLGEGGAGAVFLATDPRLDRPVAIKVLAPREGDGRGARGLGVEEARALARLAHPNVVVVHDVGEQDGQVWLAMEYVAGGTLREWRARNPDAGWFEVARHALGAARGLAAAHDKGLVHRDFKPDNVMVGDDGRARVADFGLALSDGQAPASGLVEGTPSYLPPEVLAGAPPSALGDQYSFCASLRELLVAGQGAPSEAAPASPPDRPPWPEALSALVARGLAADPPARWPTMNAVVERLEALVLAPPDPRRDALIARVRGIWLDGVQATALLGADPVPLDVVAVPEAVEHASPAASTRRGRRTTATLAHELTRAYGALLLLGGPGAGKTTALLGLARELLERAERDPTAPVPVVLNLASAAGARGTLAAWVADELVTKYGLPRRRALQWLDDDALVLLLDGLDEAVVAVSLKKKPRVEVVEPGWCVIPTRGPSRYFGGDDALVALVAERVRAVV
ncbi:MAG: serine/threonine protein kinase, partial [Myxococcales bacterium]|nr:serine/threonine protein kinase [Myxococcales bacterium]